MAVERLDTRDGTWVDDPRLADYRAVRDPELVRRGARFLAEGRLVVRTLLSDSLLRARSLLLEEAALAAFEAEDVVLPPELPVYVVPPGAMGSLSGFRFHQGCLAVGERPPAEAPADLLARLGSAARLVVGLDGVSNPDNVGAIFRTAAAFGAGAVLLSPDCASPLYRKAVRTSMGACLRLPFSHGASWSACLRALDDHGARIIALTPAAEARTLEAAAAGLGPDQPRALLLGAEGPGLGAASVAAASEHVRIPMSGGVDSLNVAAAAAVALYRLRT